MNWLGKLIQIVTRLFGGGTHGPSKHPSTKPHAEDEQPSRKTGLEKSTASRPSAPQIQSRDEQQEFSHFPAQTPWAKANDKFNRSKEGQAFRKKVLERAGYKCEKHGHETATAVRWREYPKKSENPKFKKPELSDKWAVCGSCAKELTEATEWSDPHHPWFPKEADLNGINAQTPPDEQPALFDLSKIDGMPWGEANEKFFRSTEGQVLGNRVLRRAGGKCEMHRHDLATTIRWKKYPKKSENPKFKKPKLSDLWAVCGSCAEELSDPSDWSDRQHPWFPKHADLKGFSALTPGPANQLSMSGEGLVGSIG